MKTNTPVLYPKTGSILTLSAAGPGRPVGALGSGILFRLYLIPFCVSSITPVLNHSHAIVIFPSRVSENAWPAGLVGSLLCAIVVAKTIRIAHRQP